MVRRRGTFVSVIFSLSIHLLLSQIIKIDRANQRVFVHYTYWDFKFDEWVDNISNRIVPVHTHTYVDGGELKEGQRIEVLDDRSKWLEAFIIDENDTQVIDSLCFFLFGNLHYVTTFYRV